MHVMGSEVLISPTLLSYSAQPGPTATHIWLHFAQFFFFPCLGLGRDVVVFLQQ